MSSTVSSGRVCTLLGNTRNRSVPAVNQEQGLQTSAGLTGQAQTIPLPFGHPARGYECFSLEPPALLPAEARPDLYLYSLSEGRLGTRATFIMDHDIRNDII